MTGSADDAFFLVDHPESDGKSIIVVGTYFDGATTVDFTYESDLNEEQELALDPVLVISEDGGATGTNVTLRFDVSTWFVDGTGRLFNPETALVGEPNAREKRPPPSQSASPETFPPPLTYSLHIEYCCNRREVRSSRLSVSRQSE